MITPTPNTSAEKTIALATARRARDGVWDVRALCPHCGLIHLHGGGDGPRPYGGGRLSECLLGHYHVIIVEVQR